MTLIKLSRHLKPARKIRGAASSHRLSSKNTKPSVEKSSSVSAGGVVLNVAGQVLIVNQNGNSWSLPKGHLDAGEDELRAARREIYEEAGIKKLKLVRKLGTYQRTRIGLKGGVDSTELKTITLFLFHTQQMNLKPIDPQNPEARWVDREAVVDFLTHPKDKEFYLSIVKQLPAKRRV
jgi:8-oxo-dGTP pyrophosphatase MutT (NUDIX family)